MEQVQFLTLIEGVLMLALKLMGPILLVAMLVGLIISVFQSVTQIQEATLTFVPKIIAGIVTLILLLPWMMNSFLYQTHEWFAMIQTLVR